MLGLALALTLAAADGATLATLPPGDDSPFHEPSPSMLAFGAGAFALGVGSAVCTGLDRQGGLGRACTIVGGTLGFATLGGYLGALFAYLGEKDRAARELAIALGATVGVMAGAVVGLVSSILLSARPGDVRDVLGIGGGSVLAAGGVNVMVFSFTSDFR